MKKITGNLLLLFILFTSITGYTQLAQEGFEGASFPPSGWSLHNNGIGVLQQWKQTIISENETYPPKSGNHAAFIDRQNVPDGDPAKDWLVTSLFEMPSNGQLRFWSRLTLDGNQGSVYKVLIAPEGSDLTSLDSFTVVAAYTETEINPTQREYNEVFISLPGTAGQNYHVAFLMEGDFQDRWLIDDVRVVEECLAPTNLNASSLLTTSADLSWQGTASQYEIEIIPVSENPIGAGIAVNGNSYSAIDLVSGTDYEFYVKAICNEDTNESIWTGPYVFSTTNLGDTCAAPLQITSLPYAVTDNTSNYGDDYNGAPGATCGATLQYLNGNDVVYSYTPTEDGIISIDLEGIGTYTGIFIYDDCADIGVSCIEGGVSDFSATPVSIPTFSVTADTTYYMVISSWLAQNAAYSLTVQEVNCAPPTNLSASNLGLTTANLSWDTNGSSSWEVVVQAQGTGIPAGAGTTTAVNNNYNITTQFNGTPLTAATNYEYYVRADCGDGTFSSWAGPYQFSTAVCDITQQCSYIFTLTDTSGDGWNGNTISILQNNVEVAVLGPGFAGTGPYEVTVQVCNDTPIEIFWNSGGFSAYQIGLTARNGFNQTFYSKPAGTGTQNSLLYSGIVECDEPLCLSPTQVTVSNATTTSVDLTWNDVPGSYEYFYLPAGSSSPLPTTEGFETTENNVTIEGLDPSTNYDFYVRYVCPDNSLTQWTGPIAGHTTVCESQEQCVFSFEMTSESGNGWQGNTMTVFQGGVEIQTIGTSFTSGTSLAVAISLCPGVPIEVFWNNSGSNPTDKGLIIHSQYEDIFAKLAGTGSQGSVVISGTVSCDAPACSKPQDISLEAVSPNSATFNWNQTGDAESWEVWVLPAGSPAPVGNGEVISENPYTAEGLDPATPYDFYIRTNCGPADGYSTWSLPLYFVTPIGNDNCEAAAIVPVNTTAECIDFTPVSFTGATASLETVCNGINGGDVWYEFVAGAPTHIITLSNFTVRDATALPYVIALYENACGNTLGTPLYCSQNNAINAINLTVGTTYKIRISLNSNSQGPAANVGDLCITTPDTDGNGASQCLVTTINSDFELPVFDLGGWAMFHQNAVPGWRTTASDGMIEYWGDGFNGVPAYSGNQFIELNANLVSGVYQDYVAPSGTVFEYGFAHRGRQGTDTCQLLAGPPGGPYLPVGNPVSTDTADWSYNTGTYTVPANQGVTRFIFESVSSSGGPTIGNFLDAITFNANTGIVTPSPLEIDCANPIANIEAIGAGTWVAYSTNPGETVIQDPNSNITTISGFTIPGNYYYEWSTPFCNSTLIVTYSAIDIPAPVVSNLTYCTGMQAAPLTAEVLNGYTINWYDSETGAPLTEVPTPDTSVAGTAVYYVSQTNANGCESPRAAIEVAVHALPVANVVEDVLACNSYILPALNDGNSYYTGLGAGGSLLEEGTEILTGQTIYIFAQTEGTECSDESSFTVSITNTPLIEVNGGCEGGIYVIELSLDENYTEDTVIIEWTGPSGNTISSALTAQAEETGDYTVTVTPLDSNICSAVHIYPVDNIACQIQRGISPNGDEKNDRFDLNGFNVSRLTIFNRYGREVYNRNNYTDEWYGLDKNGNELPTGTYYYSIELSNGDSKTGWVYINRQEN